MFLYRPGGTLPLRLSALKTLTVANKIASLYNNKRVALRHSPMQTTKTNRNFSTPCGGRYYYTACERYYTACERYYTACEGYYIACERYCTACGSYRRNIIVTLAYNLRENWTRRRQYLPVYGATARVAGLPRTDLPPTLPRGLLRQNQELGRRAWERTPEILATSEPVY